MKPDSQPQLLAEIEQHGSVTHIEGALINIYFRSKGGWHDAWRDMLAWADSHGFTVRPRDPTGDPAAPVRIAKRLESV